MLRERLKNHQSIIENTFFLSVIEVVNMLVPVLALPYIIRTIGAANYGLIVFVQSIVAYFSIAINFGLNISAVKNVSQNRNDKKKVSEIVCAVIGVKFILFIIIFLAYLALVFGVPGFRQNWCLFLFAFLISVNDLLFPQWYYQGVERMKYITLVRLSAVLFYLSTLFILVKEASDYIYIPLLQSCGAILSGFIGLYMLIHIEKIRYRLPSFAQLRVTFNEGKPFFLSQISKTINENIAVTMSGAFLGMTEAATFALAKRIITFAATPGEMLCQALFPRNPQNQNISYFRKFLYFIFAAILFEVVVTYFLSPFIVHFFAKDTMPEAVPLLRFLLLYLILVPVATYIGYSGLVAFGYAKYFNYSIYFSVFIQLFGLGFFYVIGYFNLYSLAVTNILSMGALLLFRLYFCKKNGIL